MKKTLMAVMASVVMGMSAGAFAGEEIQVALVGGAAVVASQPPVDSMFAPTPTDNINQGSLINAGATGGNMAAAATTIGGLVGALSQSQDTAVAQHH